MADRFAAHAPDCNCCGCEPYTEWLGTKKRDTLHYAVAAFAAIGLLDTAIYLAEWLL